jgi:hypothetical protein
VLGVHFIPIQGFLKDFYTLLKNKELLPGRRILRDDPDMHLSVLEEEGFLTLGDLLRAIRNNKLLATLSRKINISEEYLVILRREAGSYFPTPVALFRLTGDESLINTLDSEGIKDSRDLLERAAMSEKRMELADKTGLDREKLDELVQISDLVRINGVGPVFARIIFNAGLKSVRDFRETNTQKLFSRLNQSDQQNKQTEVKFTMKDVEFCREYASLLEVIVD